MKMIVLDLDGTILNKDRKISESTKKYLNKLKKDGYIVVIATGRIYASALKATDGADFANYVISDTGACIYERLNSAPIFTNFIDTETAKAMFDYYNENCRYVDICDKNTIFKYSDEPEYSEVIETTKDRYYIINNCSEISHITISMKTNEDVMRVYNDLRSKFTNLEIIIMQDSFSERKWIEMMAKGTSKYNSINNLANYLNIKNEEIIAFGDGLNDIEMLEKCGYGVALDNALPAVKNKANDVTTLDHNNDGVINYLKEHLYDKEVG